MVVTDPARPTVSWTEVLVSVSVERGGLWPSPKGTPGLVVSGRQVSWGPGDRLSAVSCRDLTMAAHWVGPGLEVVGNLCPILCDLMAASSHPGSQCLGRVLVWGD